MRRWSYKARSLQTQVPNLANILWQIWNTRLRHTSTKKKVWGSIISSIFNGSGERLILHGFKLTLFIHLSVFILLIAITSSSSYYFQFLLFIAITISSSDWFTSNLVFFFLNNEFFDVKFFIFNFFFIFFDIIFYLQLF